MRSTLITRPTSISPSRLVTIAVVAISAGLTSSQLEAKKPGQTSDPHWVQLVDGSESGYLSPVLQSWGLTQFPGPVASGNLDDEDFIPINFENGITLSGCAWTVHKRGGAVVGVTFFFTTENGWHRTDELPATANGMTIQVRLDNIEVWKESGRGKGTVVGTISVDDIVYEPVQ